MRPGVAIESSRRRCHSGWSISAATWPAIPARTGLPVSSAIRRWKQPVGLVPALAGGRIRRVGGGLHRGQQRARTRRPARPRSAARRAIAGSSSARASSRSVGLASCGRPLGAGRRSAASAATNEPEPGRVSITPCDLQRGDRLAHGGAADLEPAREVALGRQPLAGREGARADLAREPLGHVLVALQRPYRLERRTRLDGNWFAHRTSKVHAMATTFNSVDPRTGEPGPAYEEATPTTCAPRSPPPPTRTAPARSPTATARAALLRGAAARLRAAGDEIVATARPRPACPRRACAASSSAPPASSRRSPPCVDAGDYVEAIIDTPDPDAKPIPRPDVRRMLVPIGPVAVFGASNFPLAFSTAGGDTASALAAGVPGDRQGPPVAPGHERARRARAVAPRSPTPACPRARSRTCRPRRSRSRRRWSTRPRSRPSASPAPTRAGARSPTAPPRGPSRSRSTPRWAP